MMLLSGLSALLSGAVGQNQYRPEGGAAESGTSARGGSRGQESGTGAEGSLEETIPGIPGDDYPIFAEVPDTSFVCDGLVEGGYYADVEAECQVFHICGNDGNGGLTKYSFLCPNGTIFQQQYFVCDWWFNVDCSLAEDLYSLNEEYAAEREANIGAGGSDGGDGVQAARGQAGQGNRGGQSGGQAGGQAGGSRGSSGQGGGRGGQTGGQTGGRGGTRGSSAQSGGRPGGRRPSGSQGGGRRGGGSGSQPGYLAPSSDYEESLSGYGAPLGGQQSDFPPLSQYTRNARDSEYVVLSEEEIMDKEA